MKTLGKIMLGIAAILLGLVVFLAGSVVVAGMGGAGRLEAITNTKLQTAGGETIWTYVAHPEGEGPFPAVIMIHEFWGLNQEITEKAEALADEGYVVVAPNMFRSSTTTWIPRAIYQVIATPEDRLISDLDAVFAWMQTQPDILVDRTGIMGFCFGGRTSLVYSLANNQLGATVVLYGSPETDPAKLAMLPGPVLGIFGGADNSIPLADVEAFDLALDEAGIENTVTVYEGQPHAFVTNMDAIRAGGAPGEAWAQVLGFFDSALKQSPPPGGALDHEPIPLGQDWRYLAMLVYEHAFGTASHGH